MTILRRIETVIAEEPVLIQAQALLLGPSAHQHIVLLAAREVEQRSAEGLLGHDAQVDLQPILHADAGLGRPHHQHLGHARHRAERIHGTRGIRRCGNEVDVADGLLAASKAAGGLDPGHGSRCAEMRHRRLGHRQRMVDAHAADGGLQELDAIAEVLDLLRAESCQTLEAVLDER